MPTAGLVLAAGAGTRFGGPKALARETDGTPWLLRAAAALHDGGCDPVIVCLGAGAAEARALAPAWARVVEVRDWAAGLSATLRAGLAAAEGADAVVVVPVDTPDLPAAAVARMVGSGSRLAQAVYDGSPGHPALLGAEHFMPLSAWVAGDAGARGYLVAQGARRIECGDLWSGADVDVDVSSSERGQGD